MPAFLLATIISVTENYNRNNDLASGVIFGRSWKLHFKLVISVWLPKWFSDKEIIKQYLCISALATGRHGSVRFAHGSTRHTTDVLYFRTVGTCPGASRSIQIQIAGCHETGLIWQQSRHISTYFFFKKRASSLFTPNTHTRESVFFGQIVDI